MHRPSDRTQLVARHGLLRSFDAATAAGLAGLIGGAAFLLAQMTFSGLLTPDGPWAPLHRIAAILLGSDEAAPASTGLSFVVVSMAVLIHFPLAALYGRWIGRLVQRLPLSRAAGVGAGCGLILFVLNYYLLAPSAFPWFVDARSTTAAVDHALFGAIVAAAALLLRRSGGAHSPTG